MIDHNSHVIVSVVSETIRSTGDILDSGAITYPASSICTTIMPPAAYTDFANLMSRSDMYERHGALGLDGLLVPYSTYYEHSGVLPHFERPSGIDDLTDLGLPQILASGLNVYNLHPFNPNFVFGTGHRMIGGEVTDTGVFNSLVWATGGHNTSLAATANNFASQQSIEDGKQSASAAFDSDYHYRKKVELIDVKGIALKVPLVLSGTGYNESGLPVPPAPSGSGMHPEGLWNTSLWKTGPLAIRWHSQRKVWIADGAQASTILFRVVASVFCGDCYVVARIIAVPGGQELGDVPAVDYSYEDEDEDFQGQPIVLVYDKQGCFFNEPPEDLLDRLGWATYMNCLEDGPCPDTAGNRWCVTSLCCLEETCG